MLYIAPKPLESRSEVWVSKGAQRSSGSILTRVVQLPVGFGERSIMLRPCIGTVVAAVLGGCSSTFFSLPDTPTSLDPGPADYQALVAKNLLELKDRTSLGSLEISPLRQTRLAQSGDWFACVRTTVQEQLTHFAFFIREGRVIEWRQAVLVDGCAQEQFQPLRAVQ
jgi:hypothetical protein